MMELIDAMSTRLDEIFDGEYAVYLEEVEQNLQTPCFFIQPLTATDKNMIDNRRYRTYGFAIQFIPGTKAYRSLFADVTKKLFDNFDDFPIGDDVTVYTFDRTVNVIDDVLHFTVLFKCYEYTDKPSEPAMEDLEIR